MAPADDSVTAPLVKLRTEAGIVWESEEKRFVQLGDHHWCGTNNEPEPVDDSTIEHVCRIWRVSEDQEWRPPQPVAPQSQDPIDALIQRVQLTGGDLEGNNIPVLAMLYQARSLEMMEFTMREMLQAVERIAGALETWRESVIQNRGGSTPLQTESGGSGQDRSGLDYAKPIESATTTLRHAFADGERWRPFCSVCGGGRLHPIHQV